MAGIEKVTTEAGYDLIIAHSSESFEKEAANALNLFHKRVDGLIASGYKKIISEEKRALLILSY